jgi:hypothetical protein
MTALAVHRRVANAPLAALVLANGISAVGDWLYLTALPVLIYLRTGDAALLGLAAAGRLVPWLLLSLPAGIVADRLPKRAILVVSETTRCVLMLAIAVLCVTGGDLLAILVAATAAAAAGTFALPAQSGLAPQLARDAVELGRANALLAGLDSLATVLGPALAGLLLLGGRLELAFAINGVSFGAVVLLLLALPSGRGAPASAADFGTASAPDGAPAASHTGPGWRVIARLTAPTLVLDAAISFASAALTVLPVVIAVELLAAGDAFAGAIAAAGGLGGLAGAAAAARFVGAGLRSGFLAGVAVSAIGLVGLAAGAHPALALAGGAAATGGLILLDTLNATRLQTAVPAGGIGRAFGLLNTSAAAWAMAGSVLPPVVAASIGAPAAVTLAAGAVVVLGGAAVWGDRRRANGEPARCPKRELPEASSRAA